MERAASLTETLFGRPPPPEVWQDREVRFDLAPAELACRRGEEVLDFLVGETLGGGGFEGVFDLGAPARWPRGWGGGADF
jgi:hypothetical protein